MVSETEFRKLTNIPILIVYGDNIVVDSSNNFNAEIWCIASIRAKQLVDTVNRYGGDARIILLPEIGIKGNTHAMFADMNNIEIADILEQYFHEKDLDGRASSYLGPKKPITDIYTIPMQAKRIRN